MPESLQQLLAELEREAGVDAAEASTQLVVQYLADTRTGAGRVSTALTPADLAARFVEPLPRRVDAFKVWVVIQRYGASGIGALYEHLCATARCLYNAILARPGFRALHEPESNIRCFRYAGDGSFPDDRLDALSLGLRTAYNREGDGWTTSTVLGGRRVLRVTVMNPRTTAADLERMLYRLDAIGAMLLQAS